MSSELNLLKINKFVLHKQRLAGEKADESLVETGRAVGGLHATNAATPYLSLFARRANFRREQLDAELYVKRNLCKIRKCCQKKELKGCWKCDVFATCKNLDFLQASHGTAHLKNLAAIKKKGVDAFIQGKRLWYSK